MTIAKQSKIYLDILNKFRSAVLITTHRRGHLQYGHGLRKKTSWGVLQDASNEEEKLY